MSSSLRPPRSAPALLTTSFSLPSLADYPPSPADPNFPPKQWTGPYASLSRRGSRWALDVGGEGGAGDADSDDEAMLRRSASERNVRKRRQLESQVLALKTIIAEQANTLSALNRAKFDLGETIEGLKGAVRDAEDERRAAESEREWLAREVEYLRNTTGVNATPPTIPYVARRPGSAGRTPLESRRAQPLAADENVPPVPRAPLGERGGAGQKAAKRHLAERRNAPHPPSIRTESLGPQPSPTPQTAAARLQTTTTASALSPSPSSGAASPAPLSLSALASGAFARAVRPKAGVRRTMSARRKRSLELLSLSAGLLADGETEGAAGGGEGEWQSIVRTQGYLSHSDPSDDEQRVERRPNLRPSALPASRSGWRVWTARGALAGAAEDREGGAAEGELMEVLKRLVPDVDVRRFRHLVKKFDNGVLSHQAFLSAARTTVLGPPSPLAAPGAHAAEREQWVQDLEELVRWQVAGGGDGDGGECA